MSGRPAFQPPAPGGQPGALAAPRPLLRAPGGGVLTTAPKARASFPPFSVRFFFFFKSFEVECTHVSVRPHAFSQPATPLHPAGQEPQRAQPPTSPPVTLQPSPPARLTTLLMSNIEQFTCFKPHDFGNFPWHLKPAYYVSIEQGLVPAQAGTD